MTAYSHLRRTIRIAGSKAMRLPARAYGRGQAMVEFALIATLSLLVLLVGIQFAIIGQAALAVTQASYLGARAASVNSNMTSNQLSNAIANQMSPTITFGCPINVTVNYDATSKLFLPASWSLPIFGRTQVIIFPTALTSTESAMTE